MSDRLPRVLARGAAWLTLGLLATSTDALLALTRAGAADVALPIVVVVGRVLAALVTVPVLALLVGGLRPETPRAALRGIRTQLSLEGLCLAAFLVVSQVVAVLGPRAGALLGVTAAATFHVLGAYATRIALRDGLGAVAAIDASAALVRRGPAKVLGAVAVVVAGLVAAAFVSERSLLAAFLCLSSARAAFEATLTRDLAASRERDEEEPPPTRRLATAPARGLEMLEYILLGVFFVIGVVGSVRLASSQLGDHTHRVADCVAGQASCGGEGGAAGGEGGASGGESGGGAGPGTVTAAIVGAPALSGAAPDMPAGDIPLAPLTPAQRAQDLLAIAVAANNELYQHTFEISPARARELRDDAVRAAAMLRTMEAEALRDRSLDGETYAAIVSASINAQNAARGAMARADQALAHQNFQANAGPVLDSFFAGAILGGYANDHSIAAAVGQVAGYFIPYVNVAFAVRDISHGGQEIYESGGRNPWGYVEAAGGALGVVGALPRVAGLGRSVAANGGAGQRVAAQVAHACDGFCTRPLTVGDSVLVPRSNGAITGGRIIEDLGGGRFRVEVRVGDEVGTRVNSAHDLLLRREIGEQVQFVRSDGVTHTVGTIVERLPDGQVRVQWMEGDQVASRLVHETLVVTPPRAITAARVQAVFDHLVQIPVRDAPGMAQAARTVSMELSQLPNAVLRELNASNFRFIIRPGHVADELAPEVRNLTPRGYPPGLTFENVRGVYMPDRHVAVVGADQFGRLSRPAVVLHEAGHAVDKMRGFPSRSAEFQAAIARDAPRQLEGPFANPYFRLQSQGGSQATMDGVASEIYAEAFQTYHRNPTLLRDRSPAIYEYFRRTEPSS